MGGKDQAMDVVCFGEMLIDFTPVHHAEGFPHHGLPQYLQNPGGAPANVAVVLAQWGKKAAFVGKVGDDFFGHFLQQTLQKHWVNTESLLLDEQYQTTLAFVHLQADGERSFSFYRAKGADCMIDEKEIDPAWIKRANLFHFGSVSMTNEPARSATLKALDIAVQDGKTISFDPNVRELLWNDLNEAHRVICSVLHKVSILKCSFEELRFLTRHDDLETATLQLYEQYQIPYIFITLGSEGCYYRVRTLTGHVPGHAVKAIDTTGAGDVFVGAMLYAYLNQQDENDWSHRETIESVLTFANVAAGLSTTKKGAIPSIPSLEDVMMVVDANVER